MLDVFRELLHGTGLKSIRTSVANHCPDSFCVALVTKEGKKVHPVEIERCYQLFERSKYFFVSLNKIEWIILNLRTTLPPYL